MSAYLTVIRRS